MSSKARTLVESECYQAQLEKLGNIERLDDALLAATWALAQNPEYWPVIDGTEKLRILKLDCIPRGRGKQSIAYISFSIRDAHHIDLWGIELEEADG